MTKVTILKIHESYYTLGMLNGGRSWMVGEYSTFAAAKGQLTRKLNRTRGGLLEPVSFDEFQNAIKKVSK